MPKIFKITKEIYLSSMSETVTIKDIENLDLYTLGHIENYSGEVRNHITVVEKVNKEQLPLEIREAFFGN